jgi:hypothetical protein
LMGTTNGANAIVSFSFDEFGETLRIRQST